MRAAVRKLGNSSGVIIPKSILVELGVSPGDAMDLSAKDGCIVLQPVRPKVRAGWAEEAKALAAAGDDALVWPEFGNADDEALEW